MQRELPELTFATFDVDVPDETVEKVLAVEPRFFRCPSHEMIKALFASARRVHPSCRTVILTDQTTPLLDFSNDIEIKRYNLNTQKLTMSRTQAQLQYLKETKGQSHLVFLDTDMLIQQSLNSIFAKSFDVGLTYRTHQMPINGGVILINARGYQKACAFMEKILGLIESKYLEFQTWYGSQYALKEIVPIPQNLEKEEMILTIEEGIRVLLLPCDTYNFNTYPSRLMNGYYPDKIILHFKGTRKEFLVPYYNKYLLNKPDEPKKNAEYGIQKSE